MTVTGLPHKGFLFADPAQREAHAETWAALRCGAMTKNIFSGAFSQEALISLSPYTWAAQDCACVALPTPAAPGSPFPSPPATHPSAVPFQCSA